MHGENNIRRFIGSIIDHYGVLDTTQIKNEMKKSKYFDEDDKVISDTRVAEFKVIQRIGNIISHQKQNIKIYKEGFVVDKTNKPAQFLSFYRYNFNNKNN